jgi:hypothetical protein
MKANLTQIIPTLNAVINDLNALKDSVEKGLIPFLEQDYFNLVLAMERINEAKERLDGVIQRD